uniref:Transposable element P transposase n=1 Tax=Amphimedon queenslandica TaxID=400682 RepID=A0A1X7TLU3_AMPQE
MHIKEGFMYNKHNGELVGFCDLGEISNHLISLEKEYQTHKTAKKQLASTMMVLMVRSIFTSFIFPYASFPASNLTGKELVPIFFEALFRRERCGLNVTSITMDGTSVNRKFFTIVGSSSSKPLAYKFSNPINENTEVFFFSDPPHLIKTARNCLQNPKRHMEINGKQVSWKHIESLYKKSVETTGLTIIPKIKHEHIYVTPFSKMRVDLAAQVLSETMAKALTFHFKEKAEETAKFVKYFDKFFDMFNVTNYTKCYKERKMFQAPYRMGNDSRLEVINVNK